MSIHNPLRGGPNQESRFRQNESVQATAAPQLSQQNGAMSVPDEATKFSIKTKIAMFSVGSVLVLCLIISVAQMVT